MCFFLQKGSVLDQALFPQDDGPLGTWLNSQVMCLDSKDQSMGISQGHKASIKIFITHHHEPSIRPFLRPAISQQDMWHLWGVDGPLRISHESMEFIHQSNGQGLIGSLSKVAGVPIAASCSSKLKCHLVDF